MENKAKEIDDKYITKQNGKIVLENKIIPFQKYDVEVAEYDSVCDKKVKSVKIPEETNIIGLFAFSDCEEIEEIVVPENVSAICACAFLNCAKLNTVFIKNPDTYISNNAFKNCRKPTIYSLEESEVADFAKKHGFPFKKLQ